MQGRDKWDWLCGVIVVDVLWTYVVTQNVLVQELFDAVALV